MTREMCAAPTWAEAGQWKIIDLALRSIAKRRAALDVAEARWLREAERIQVWRQVGMVSALDYCERVLGYGPRAAQERLRVARALGDLPAIEDAFERGVMSYSAVRELSRVATRWTEEDWLAEAIGKNLREIEELVAEHEPGDLPGDPKNPRVRRHTVSFEIEADTLARLREVRRALADEHGRSLDDNDFIAALAASVLDAPRTDSVDEPSDGGSVPTGRAKHQIAVVQCEQCGQGWHDAAGVTVPIDAAAMARAECDAQWIGSLDAAAPSRAHHDVTPAVARLVWRRDHARCRVPGCRSSRGLEIHHIVARAAGGSHEAENLVLLCSACHHAHHRGLLAISGTAASLDVRRPDSRAHVSAIAPSAAAARIADDARRALVTLGWPPAVARAAVADAATTDSAGDLAHLIRAALRRCPMR